MATRPNTCCPVAAVLLPKEQARWDVGDWVQWAETPGLPVHPGRLALVPIHLRADVRRIIDRRVVLRAAEARA